MSRSPAQQQRRRPHSSVPVATTEGNTRTPVLPRAQPLSLHRHSAASDTAVSAVGRRFASQSNLFRDSYGAASGLTVSPHRADPPRPSAGAVVGDASRRAASRHRPPVAAPTADGPRRTPCDGTAGTADAIVFQYHARRQQQQRQQRGVKEGRSSSAAPAHVPPQSSSSSALNGAGNGRSGVITPTTTTTATAAHGLFAPISSSSSRPPTHDRGAGSSGSGSSANAAGPHRSTSSPPPCGVMGSICDTSASLVPATSLPPTDERHRTRHHNYTGGGNGSSNAASWPVQLSPAQHQQCEELVGLLSQLPAAQAHQVLLAATRQYEAQRLMRHYGGLHALPTAPEEDQEQQEAATESAKRDTAARTPSASSLVSLSSTHAAAASPLPRPPREEGSQSDGRAALLRVLRARLDDMERADVAARALATCAMSPPAHQRQCSAAGNGVCATPHQRQPPQRSPSQATRPPARSGRAPRQLRGRIMESRTSKSRTPSGTQNSRAVRNGSSPATAPASSAYRHAPPPPPTPDFMQTVKPPQRHGLTGALRVHHRPTVAPASSSHGDEISDDASSADARCIIAMELSTSVNAEEEEHQQLQGRFQADTRAPPPVVSVAPSASAHVPLPDPPQPAPPPKLGLVAVWPPAFGSTLSPGAAAARRAYWEQQQRDLLHQQLHTPPPHTAAAPPHRIKEVSDIDVDTDEDTTDDSTGMSNFLRGSTAAAQGEDGGAGRYPINTSSDRLAGLYVGGLVSPTAATGATSSGFGMEDSVRRSEVLPLVHTPPVAQQADGATPLLSPPKLPGVPPVPLPPLPPPPAFQRVVLSPRAEVTTATMATTSGAAAFLTDISGAGTSTSSQPPSGNSTTAERSGVRDGRAGSAVSPDTALSGSRDHGASADGGGPNTGEADDWPHQSASRGSSSPIENAPLPQSSPDPVPVQRHTGLSTAGEEADSMVASSIPSEPLSGDVSVSEGALVTASSGRVVPVLGVHPPPLPPPPPPAAPHDSPDEFKLPWEL